MREFSLCSCPLHWKYRRKNNTGAYLESGQKNIQGCFVQAEAESYTSAEASYSSQAKKAVRIKTYTGIAGASAVSFCCIQRRGYHDISLPLGLRSCRPPGTTTMHRSPLPSTYPVLPHAEAFLAKEPTDLFIHSSPPKLCRWTTEWALNTLLWSEKNCDMFVYCGTLTLLGQEPAGFGGALGEDLSQFCCSAFLTSQEVRDYSWETSLHCSAPHIYENPCILQYPPGCINLKRHTTVLLWYGSWLGNQKKEPPQAILNSWCWVTAPTQGRWSLGLGKER